MVMLLETLYFREASQASSGASGSVTVLGLDIQRGAETNSQTVGRISNLVPLKTHHPSAGLIDGAAFEVRPAVSEH